MRDRSFALTALLSALFTACGDDAGNDGLLQGFSGVVILVLLIWFIVHRTRRK